MAGNQIKTITGKIVDIKNGEKQMNRHFTYGYMVLRVFSDGEYYGVLINANKLNSYGFLPRVGHWVKVEGKLSYPKNDLNDRSMNHVKTLQHVEAPNALMIEILEKLKRD